VELEVDPDPSVPPPSMAPVSGHAEPLESRSRLVSAPPAKLELELDDSDPDPEPPSKPSDPTIEVAAAEVSGMELAAIEEAESERAPASSRRPISIEAKMAEPVEEEAPLHTAPRESGAHRAAVPALDVGFEPIPAPPAAPSPAHEAIFATPAPAQVASFVGQTSAGRSPKSFGELLDDALSL
jgi:hypothetical protein